MGPIVRQSILIALFAGVHGRWAVAQVPPPRRLPPADTSAGKSHILPVVEITGFLALLSAYDRYAYANAYQDGKKVYR